MITLNQQGLEKLFQFKVKESVSLAYISASEVADCNERKELFFATLISSMANAAGGIIFVGIAAQRKIPKKIEPITNANALEWLQLVCNNCISPKIPNCSISKIIVSELQDYIIAIKVDNSHVSPHMSADKHFYKRVDGKPVLLEEYEIRDLYNKGKRSELELYSITNTSGIPIMSGGKFQLVNFYPRILIKNTSASIEQFFKIEIAIPSQLHNPNFETLHNHFSRFDDGNTIFSILHKTPLYQNEIATVAEANIIVDATTYKTFEDGEIIISLYYSSGIVTKTLRCKELFLYRNKQIQFDDFMQTQVSVETSQKQENLSLF